MERETKTITTPLGKTVVLKTYFTARERNALKNVYLQGKNIDIGNVEESVKQVKGETLEIAEHKLLELAVVSYNGITENILNTLLDSMPNEYDFVLENAGKINIPLAVAK